MHLLTNAGKTISEAAFESGFESAAHFSRSFKERFGMTAREVKMGEVVQHVYSQV